jgi:ABC-type multidrug transport system ATPase subunit
MVEFACQVKDRALERRTLEQLLSLTDLTDEADRLLGELSYGTQRKAAWVVALASSPTALLLDEGLAGLDATSREALTAEVASRVRAGLGVLWTEHDLDPVTELLSRVLVLHQGKIAETVSGDEVRRLAQNAELAPAMRRWTSL